MGYKPVAKGYNVWFLNQCEASPVAMGYKPVAKGYNVDWCRLNGHCSPYSLFFFVMIMSDS